MQDFYDYFKKEFLTQIIFVYFFFSMSMAFHILFDTRKQ